MLLTIIYSLIQYITIRHGHCYIYFKEVNQCPKFISREANMKQFMTIIEDLWVAVAFAEAGITESAAMHDPQPLCLDSVRIHTA